MKIIENTKNKSDVSKIIFTSKEVRDLTRKYMNRDLNAVFKNLRLFFRSGRNKKYYADTIKDQDVNYPYIPLEMSQQIISFAAVKEYIKYTQKSTRNIFADGVNFLDAGCGIGNVINTANRMNLSVNDKQATYSGIELDPLTYDMARAITFSNYGNVNIFNENIITFKHYKKYNVVYFFCPIQVHPLQTLFEEILEDKIKKGAIIMPNLSKGTAVTKDKRFKKIIVCQDTYQAATLLEKVKGGKRTNTSLTMSSINRIPKKYHTIFKNHIKKVQNARR